jgi:hypothetical protein
MSSHNEGRNFQALSGRRIPTRNDRAELPGFAEAIRAALHQEYGDTHAAAKTIARLTGGTDRSAKNWLAAKNGPNGRSLIALCRHSDSVFEIVIRLCDRDQLLKVKRLIDAREKLRETLALLDELEAVMPAGKPFTWAVKPWHGVR